MAIDGRITVDVLFHDTDGTTSLKVVSLEDSTAYTSGKVAIVSGIASLTPTFIDPEATGYKDAAGDEVTFSSISRYAFAASSAAVLSRGAIFILYSSGNRIAVSEPPANGLTGNISVSTPSGTASYTLVLYGT